MATLTAIFNAQDNLSKAMANAGNAGSKTTGIMQKLGKIGSVAMKRIITAVVAAGTALVAFGKKAINVGMEFETSMSQVMATMGIDKSTAEGQKAYETLSAAAEKMGSETAYTASQAADALNYLALAGYDADKAAEALPTVLHLAGAGGMELATASDMITDSMAALKMEVNQTNLDRFADQMAKTASTTNTSVSQLGEAILTVGATAANLRNGTTELNTQLGILANVGIKGSEGGTHLRNILLRLQNPTDKAAKQLKKLGVSVYDADGKMRDTGDIFSDLKAKMEGMDQKKIDKIMSTLFNKTDIAAAQALLAGSGDEYARIFSIIEKSGGAAAEMYMTMLDNLKGDIDIFKSAQEALYLSIYKSINGTLRNLVQTGTSYMQRLNDAFKAGGFEGLVTELGNVLGDAVGVVMSYSPKLVEAGTGIIIAFVESLGNNADLVANAAVDIAVALGSAIIKIAPALAKSFTQMIGAAAKALIWEIPSLFKAVPDSVYDALGLNKNHAIAKISQFAAALKAAVSKLFRGDIFGTVDSIGTAFNIDTATLDKVKGILTGIGNAFSKVWSYAQKAATAVGGFLKKFASIGGVEAVVAGLASAFVLLKAVKIGKSVMGFVKGIKAAGAALSALMATNPVGWVVAAVAALVAAGVLLYKNWDKVSESAKNVGAKIKDTFSNIGSKISTWFGNTKKWASEKWKGFKEAWANGNVGGWMKNQVNGLGQKMKGWFGDVKNWASQKWNDLKNAWNNSNVGQWFNEQFSGIGAKLGEWFGPVGTWASEKWEQIKGAWNSSDVGQWFNTQFSGIGAKLGEWFGPVGTWASEKWEEIKTAWNNGTIGDWFSEQFTGIGAKLGEWFGPASAWASEKWEEIKTAWNASDVGAWFNEQFSGIGAKLGEWFGPVGTWAGEKWEEIKNAWNNGTIGDWFSEQFNGLGEKMGEYFGSVGTWASDKWDEIKNAFNSGDPLGWFSENFSSISGKFEEWFGGIQTALEPLTGVFETIGTTIAQTFSDANGGPFGTISDIKNKIGEIVETLQGMGQKIGPAFQNIGTVALGVFSVIVTTAISLFNGIQAAVGPFISAVASAIGVVLDLVSGLLSLLGGDFSGAWESLKSAFGGFGDTLSSLGGVVVNFFTGMWTMASNIAGAVADAFSGIGDAVNGIWQSITDGIVSMVNKAIDVINGMIEGVNNLPFIDLGKIDHIGEDKTEKPGAGRADLLADKAKQAEAGTDMSTEAGAPVMDFSETDAQVQSWVSDFEKSMQLPEVQMPEVDTSSVDKASGATEALQQKVGEITNQDFGIEVDTSALTSAQTDIETAMSNLNLDGMRQALVSSIQNATQGMKLDDVLANAEMSRVDFDSLASAMGIDATALEGAINGALASADPASALTGMFAGVDLSTMLQPVGQGVGQGIAVGIEGSTGEATAAADALGAAVIEAAHSSTGVASPSSMTIPVGEGIAQGVVVGIESGSAIAVAAANAMGTSIITALSTTAGTVDLSSAGSKAVSTLSSGISSNTSAAVSAITSTGSSIRSAANSINLTAAGAHVMRGLVVGMNSMRGTLMATARNIANQLKQTIQSGMQVASPSKFTTWVGEMTGLGLVNGLERMTAKAMSAASEMTAGVASAFTPMAATVPSVTPQMSATASPYESAARNNNTAEATSERRIVVDINGGGRIDISGLTKEQAMALIAERVKPELMNVLSKEIFEGGDGVYEF